MASVKREHLGELNDKLTLTLAKEDYQPAFEKTLKQYSKQANIPGFRKGMVPAGLIRKMYGASLFTDEVLRSVDRELVKYLETEKVQIFAQPLPMELDIEQLNMNNPADYHFSFEIGLKPEFRVTDLAKEKFTRYKVTVTDEMIDNEVSRLQNRYGNMTEPEAVDQEENVLNVTFIECDENGQEIEGGIRKDNSLLVKYFAEKYRPELMGRKNGDRLTLQLNTAFDGKEREWIVGDLGLDAKDPAATEKYFIAEITKVGLLEKKELNEEFFAQLYPGQDIVTEKDFRAKISEEIQAHWDGQARNQLHDQIYHGLIDHTEISFPESFLKKWMKTQGEDAEKGGARKTDEEVEQEFPAFLNQLKWTLITDQLVTEQNIEVGPEEIRAFAKQQLFGYMGMGAMDEEQPWVQDYVERMMKDRKFVEDTYSRLQTQKIFTWAETQVKTTDKKISADEFSKMVEAHQHHHH